MERRLGNFAEYAKQKISPSRVSGLFASSMLLLTACGEHNMPNVQIFHKSGQIATSGEEPIKLTNRSKVQICTSRATPLDPNNPKDINRFMSESSIQVETINPGEIGIVRGQGSRITWSPC